MNERSIFNSPDQAIEVMFRMLARLSVLVLWLLIALAHLAIVVVALAVCWLLQISAADVKAAYLQMLQTSPGVLLTGLGLSVAGLASGYAWLVRKMHTTAAKGWLYDYLLKGSV